MKWKTSSKTFCLAKLNCHYVGMTTLTAQKRVQTRFINRLAPPLELALRREGSLKRVDSCIHMYTCTWLSFFLRGTGGGELSDFSSLCSAFPLLLLLVAALPEWSTASDTSRCGVTGVLPSYVCARYTRVTVRAKKLQCIIMVSSN